MIMPIRVGLVGFGKAGKAVARILSQAEDIDLRWIVRRSSSESDTHVESTTPILRIEELVGGHLLDHTPVDVLVDFSSAEAIRGFWHHLAEHEITTVSGISNYPSESKGYFEAIARNAPVMCSPNITLGINYLLVAAKLLQRIAPFTDIEVIEEHFRDKAERSGTAVKIAETLGLDDTKINSIRVGGIVGHHEVVFGFPYQTVRLVHDSIAREAFGTGALFAIRNLHGRAPGLYTYENLLREKMLETLSSVHAH